MGSIFGFNKNNDLLAAAAKGFLRPYEILMMFVGWKRPIFLSN